MTVFHITEAPRSRPLPKGSLLRRSDLRLFLYLLSFSLLLISCEPESIPNIEILQVDFEGDIENIIFSEDGIGHLVGGEDWNLGFYGQTKNGGQSWSFDSLTNKKMFGLAVQNDRVIIGGIDGKLFDLQGGNWIEQRTTEWGYIRGLTFVNDSSFLSVGGHAYRQGFVNMIESNFDAKPIFAEDVEFSDVQRINDQIYLAAAYGTIFRSDDGGASWQYTSGIGDFFKDILHVDDENIFAVGYNGLILKSEDLGVNWSTSRRLGDFSQADRLYQGAVIDDQIWVVGKDGLILVSMDLGNSWEKRKITNSKDLRCISTSSTHIVLGGIDGFLALLEK